MSGAYKYSPQHTQNELGYSPEEPAPMTNTNSERHVHTPHASLVKGNEDAGCCSCGWNCTSNEDHVMGFRECARQWKEHVDAARKTD